MIGARAIIALAVTLVGSLGIACSSGASDPTTEGSGPSGDGPGGANGNGGENGNGAPGGSPGATGEDPSKPPLVPGGPPVYPKDGFCGEPGVTWAWCEDFDGQGMGAPAPFNPAASRLAFRAHSHGKARGIACETSTDCAPYVQNGSLLLNAEDGGFGMNIARVEQPFDFTGREGRIHYKSDMRGHGRMHQNIHIGPQVSNSMPDLRRVTVPDALDKAPAIDVDFIGDGLEPIIITTWKDGYEHQEFKGFGPIGVTAGTLHDVDIYISKSRVRFVLDGREIANQPLADIGFETGYVYFTQLSYNPVKDGYTGRTANTFLWDNLAFDGPVLAKNSLTPAGKQDVMFRAYSKADCTVRGVPAFGPILDNQIWDTWHVQFPANAPPITAADIVCTTVPGTVAISEANIQDVERITP